MSFFSSRQNTVERQLREHFQLEKGQESGPLSAGDLDAALDELLHSGGALNRKFLGADAQDLQS